MRLGSEFIGERFAPRLDSFVDQVVLDLRDERRGIGGQPAAIRRDEVLHVGVGHVAGFRRHFRGDQGVDGDAAPLRLGGKQPVVDEIVELLLPDPIRLFVQLRNLRRHGLFQRRARQRLAVDDGHRVAVSRRR